MLPPAIWIWTDKKNINSLFPSHYHISIPENIKLIRRTDWIHRECLPSQKGFVTFQLGKTNLFYEASNCTYNLRGNTVKTILRSGKWLEVLPPHLLNENTGHILWVKQELDLIKLICTINTLKAQVTTGLLASPLTGQIYPDSKPGPEKAPHLFLHRLHICV